MFALNQQLTLTDAEFKRISKTVYEHCGINLNDDKKELVRSRLMRLVQEKNFATYDAYLDVVLQNPQGADFTKMIDRITTNLTSFFREEHHFDYLKSKILPRIVERSSAPRLRAWSAGCSTGEEAYSIAISIADSVPNLQRSDVRVLASDISTKVLSAASKGVYHEDRFAKMPPPVRNKYFSANRSDKTYQISPALRKLLIFKQINLMEKWPISTPLDFIFCRNVMIYFDRDTKEALVNRFAAQLSVGGLLFIGHSESLSNIKHDLKYVGPTIYEKQG